MPFDLPPPQDVPAHEPSLVVAASPSWDLTVGLINATVMLDQALGDGTRTVGTGFLIASQRPDGSPRTVLVTAAHVLEQMPFEAARVGWRSAQADGGWRFEPQPLIIRDAEDQPLWTEHGERDIAVMEISAPPQFAAAAIPLGWLADDDSFDAYDVGPGDELMALGYPRGLSSNRAGFPILRIGRIASWPVSPVTAFPTFLLDFAVFAGNSGGPVFWTPGARRRPGAPEPDHPFIAGVLVQEVEVGEERLEIGVVAHARFVREAIALLDAGPDAPASR